MAVLDQQQAERNKVESTTLCQSPRRPPLPLRWTVPITLIDEGFSNLPSQKVKTQFP